MWKNFFYFSKGQRIGIIVLISLIITALIANFVLPLFFPREDMPKNAFLSEVRAFKKTLVSRDSVRQANVATEVRSQIQAVSESYFC